MSDMEIRSFDIRSINDEERTVTGIAVPYGQTVNVGGYSEAFDRGAIESVDGTKLFWNHEEVIGKVTRGEDTDEGFEITAVISKTVRGEEAYTLLKDGVVDKFSVGFVPVEHRMEEDTVVRTKVDLREVSLVPFPAYSNASVLSVRNNTEVAPEGNTSNKEVFTLTENNIAPEVAELREAVSMLERKVEVLKADDKPAGPSVPVFRSFGEYAKAVAKGDSNAEEIHRAYTGGTWNDSLAGQKDGWIADSVRLLDRGRKTVNAFGTVTLPAEGMTVAHGVLGANTLDVEEQVADGDTLAFGKVSIASTQADVKTYGGYTTLSRQEIERGGIDMVDLSFRGMTIEYAKRTEKAVRDAVVAATGTSVVDALTANTAAGWLGLFADAAGALDDEGLEIDFVLVSNDVFKRLAVLVGSDGRPLLSYGSGANTIGNADVKTLTANINGIPVLRDGALAANTCIIANREAVKVWESTGAPFRLGPDDHITNLTKDYSVYGYLAVGVEMPKALVVADVDLV